LVQIFLTQLAIKRPFTFPPHPMYASECMLVKADQAKYVLKWTKNVDKFHLF